MSLNYKVLTVGDVRKPGDEYEIKNSIISKATPWAPVRLIGHAILEADLITFSYRRPLP